MKCPKCESDGILTRYVSGGALIDSSSYQKIENNYIKSSEYDFFFKLTAKKDHLQKHCGNCQYTWRVNTADDKY